MALNGVMANISHCSTELGSFLANYIEVCDKMYSEDSSLTYGDILRGPENEFDGQMHPCQRR